MQETWVKSLDQEDTLKKEILHYFCLENPVEGGAERVKVHGSQKSQT